MFPCSKKNGFLCPKSNDPGSFFCTKGYTRTSRTNSAITQKRDFDLQDAYIRLFGSGGRTVSKVLQYDLNNLVLFAPDIINLDIGTNDLTAKPPEIVGSDIVDLTRKLLSDFSVSVVVVCSVLCSCVRWLNKYYQRSY